MKNKKIKLFFSVLLKTLAILLAIIMLWLIFGRIAVPLPKSNSNYTCKRDFSLENAIESVPDEYFLEVDNSSEIEEIYYETAVTKKRAIIYLPPQYNEEKQYDIIYFQGGADSTEETYFGTPENPKPQFKNMLDNMIKNGKIKPIIAVCANFYDKPRSETNFRELLRTYQTYEEEVRNCLVPAVEGEYSTFAKSTSEKDLIESRSHRAFGGYSMGAGITWNMFISNLDYFYWFIPNCGGLQNPYVPHLSTDIGKELNNAVEKNNYSKDDFFIYSVVGTLDITYNSTRCLINDLNKNYNENFVFTQDNTKNGNITFKKKNFKVHSFSNATTYFYNAIPAIFSNQE